MKRWLILVPVAVAAALGVAGVAEAHTPSLAVSCEAGLTVSGTNYPAGGVVDIVFGGHRESHVFGESFSFHVANPDKTVAETYAVRVDAADGTGFDRVYDGMVAACVTGSTTSSPAASSTVPPSTAGTSSIPAVSTSTPATTPATSSVPATSVTPATTVAPTSPASTTTSSTVDVGIPFTPTGSTTTTTATAAPGTPSLPATGRDVSAELFGGTLAVLCGLGLVFVTRKRATR